MAFKILLNDFADWTSAAGIPQIAYAINKIIRLMWIVIWFVLFGVFVWQLYNIVTRFLSYPMSVTTNLMYGAQLFPVITFCNTNPLNYDKTTQNSAIFGPINTLMKQYTELVMNNYSMVTPDTYNLNAQPTRYEKTEWASETLLLLMNDLKEEDRELAMYKYAEVIKVCSFNGIPCTEANFTSYIDATYGRCFQFNTDPSNYRTLRGGNGFGLTVLMLVNQVDPTGKVIYLPTTPVAGAKVGINLKNEDPAMESFGISVPVGRETLIGLEFTKIERLKPPYSNCIDKNDEVNRYYPNISYTLDLCFRTCIQKHIMETIGCADPRYGRPGAFDLCKATMITQFRSLRDHQDKSSSVYFDPLTSCDCKPPCKETDIDTTVTLSRFPTEGFVVLSNADVSQAYSCQGGTVFSSQADCIRWYRDNSVLVNIFYDGLDYESYVEVPSYTFSIASNELGGQMSLWLGVSIISLIEFVCLLIVLCLYGIYGRKVKVGPSDEDLANDTRMKHVRNLRDELDAHEHVDLRLRHRAAMRAQEEAASKTAVAAAD